MTPVYAMTCYALYRMQASFVMRNRSICLQAAVASGQGAFQ